MYYAHSVEDSPEEYWQLLKDHLLAVQKEAADRGRKFGAGKAAGQAGLFHDIGRYFQK